MNFCKQVINYNSKSEWVKWKLSKEQIKQFFSGKDSQYQYDFEISDKI